MASTERESFIHKNGDDAFDRIEETEPLPLHQRGSRLRKVLVPFSIHLIMACMWFTFGTFSGRMMASSSSSNNEMIGSHYSPAETAVRPELRIFSSKGRPEKYTPLAGKPRPELEEGWSEALKYSNVRLTMEEMDAIDPSRKDGAVELPDGGYFGSLYAVHELHCVKHLHRFVYANHYFPDLTANQLEDRRLHMEHCLDTLRQGIMCRGDITPITMYWGKDQSIPLANFSSPHTCVDWESINDWMGGRSIPKMFEPGYLKHPTLGDAYSKGNDVGLTGIVHEHGVE